MDNVKTPIVSFLNKDSCTRASTKAAGNHSTLQNYRARLASAHYSQVLEAAFSPAKYAVFSTLGSCFLSWNGTPIMSQSVSPKAISAKVGCLGGTVLTILYLVLLLARTAHHTSKEDDTPDMTNWRRSVTVVLDEMFYSTVASGLGAVVYLMTSSPPPVDPLAQMVAGALGPLLLVLVFLSLMLAAWVLVRLYNLFMDWYTGYL